MLMLLSLITWQKYISMVLQILCYPCAALLLRKSKHMCRLVSVKVDYILGERYFSYGTTHKCWVLFLVRPTRSSVASTINSQVQMHTFFLFFVMSHTTLSSWLELAAIFQVTSVLLFHCKERYCDCVSSGYLPYVDSRKVVCCFITIRCLLGFK